MPDPIPMAGYCSIQEAKRADPEIKALYDIWWEMVQRCRNSKSPKYQWYGGRGITVCKRWHHFPNFHLDMSPRPPQRTLERKDNDGPYSPGNCRWATPKEQSNNRRTNSLVTYEGRTKNLTQWAEETGIGRDTLRERIKAGWPLEKVFSMKPSYSNSVRKSDAAKRRHQR